MTEAPEQIIPQSLDDYLEIMSKAVFQSGMSWKVVDAKWPGIKEAFYDFNIEKVSNFDERDLERLEQDTRVIRNARKLAAIVTNARRMRELEIEFSSFQAYLRSGSDFDETLHSIKSNFKFMGPMGIYYFLYVVGESVPPYEEFKAQYLK